MEALQILNRLMHSFVVMSFFIKTSHTNSSLTLHFLTFFILDTQNLHLDATLVMSSEGQVKGQLIWSGLI